MARWAALPGWGMSSVVTLVIYVAVVVVVVVVLNRGVEIDDMKNFKGAVMALAVEFVDTGAK